jgi:Haem-NO-binding
MHGIIFVELQKYVESRVSAEAWRELLVKSGVPTRLYMAVRPYDDAELIALVQTASTMTGTPAPVLLRDFGTFIVPGLMKTYRAFMRPEWRTLDVLEFTESHVHTKVRSMTKGAMPPFLEATRTSPTQVMMTYRSARKLCPVAEGIIEGIATHYSERIRMEHSRCMSRGDAECKIRVTLAA